MAERSVQCALMACFLLLLMSKSSRAADWTREIRLVHSDAPIALAGTFYDVSNDENANSKAGDFWIPTDLDEPLQRLTHVQAVEVVSPPTVTQSPGTPTTPNTAPDKPLGVEPPDNRLALLRRSIPLLSPGHYEVDYGIRYRWDSWQTNAIVPGPDINTRQNRARELTIPFGFRYGYREDIQPFIYAPLGVSIFEQSDFDDSTTTRVFGMGDIIAGFNYLITNEDECSPAIVAAISCTVPTGNNPYDSSPGPAALGNGFWGTGASLFFIRSYDPAVVYGGFGYFHQFDEDFGGRDFNPGEFINYHFGSGFAINPEVSLATTLIGSIQTRTKIDGSTVRDSFEEPILLRCALTRTVPGGRIWEPFVTFGLTDDAMDLDMGVIITQRK